MTKAQHRKRHIELHQALDELLADWALHNTKTRDFRPGGTPKLYSNTTIQELMEWSHRQTIEPEDPRE